MNPANTKLDEFTSRLIKMSDNMPVNHMGETSIPGFYLYKGTECGKRYPAVYEPAIVLMGQGKKIGRVDDQSFEMSVGRYVTVFIPIAWEVEVVEASPEKPLIMSGLKIDLARIANILMKIDQVAPLPPVTDQTAPSGVYSEPLTEDILDTLNRILRTADSPVEQKVLGDALWDELYFRLICNDRTGSLQKLLHHRGQIPQVSRAVSHIHSNIDQVVSVNELANLVNMSPSGFRKIFREVMHMPPLQYAKSVKLDRAQQIIQSGKNASEAGYAVGYNSPAQFSREYKRHFGFSPSETQAMGLPV